MLKVSDAESKEFWFFYDKDRRLHCEDSSGPLRHKLTTLRQARQMCIEVGYTIIEDSGED